MGKLLTTRSSDRFVKYNNNEGTSSFPSTQEKECEMRGEKPAARCKNNSQFFLQKDLGFAAGIQMFKKWFQKEKDEVIFAPLQGKVLPLTEVPDPTFSEKMLGDGVAILPTEGKVLSPIDGTVIQVFPTKHAIGLQSKGGLEILIHIGLETVTMAGEGFTSFVTAGDKVRLGDPLINFSLDKVKEKAKSTITPIVITNGKEKKIKFLVTGDVLPSKDPILSIKMK